MTTPSILDTMTAMTPTEFLSAHPDACKDGREYALQHPTMAAVWDACERPDWLFWILERHRPLTKPEAVRLAVASARSVLHLVPDGEDRPRQAVEAAEAWLADPCEATAEAARAARAAARAAAGAAAWTAAGDAARAAWAARAAYWAAYAAWAAADAAADAAYWAACWAARAASRAEQCRIIRGLIPNPFA